MNSQLHDQLKQSLQAAERRYHRLVLLVGKSGSGKTCALRAIAEELGTSVINVNLTLSGELLELTARQRSLRLPGLLRKIVDQTQTPVVLDNLEVLFDRSLLQDPLRLLQGISRNKTILASWNGSVTAGKLLYAEFGHPEYLSYDSVDALMVGMDDMATVKSAPNSPGAGEQ
jgi:DNA polymerase III delta prime subunit